MRTWLRSLAFSVVVTGIASTLPCRAQCATWDDRFSSIGTDGSVFATAVFDDGTGPALYVAGDFKLAGKTLATDIAKWNGSSWTAAGSGTNAFVYALEVFDDGSGPALYAAGDFTTMSGMSAGRIARWNGTSWSTLGSGMNSPVFALEVFDDGSGPALYAGGQFTTAGGSAASRLAKWNGSAWSTVGDGVSGNVYALHAFDDGVTRKLYVGGQFATAGARNANGIASWDGVSWSTLSTGVNVYVRALAVFDDGTGDALYAGGAFSTAGGSPALRIAKWNGSSWSNLGTSPNNVVRSLAVHDDGSGPALYVGGAFTHVGGSTMNHVARWDATGWSTLGAGTNGEAYTFVEFDAGSGLRLFAGGTFTAADAASAGGIASWDGAQWSATDVGLGMTNNALALTVHDDGSGSALYAGGSFKGAGAAGDANGVARWNGSSWSSVGADLVAVVGDASVASFAAFDDGSGPALYIGGRFASAGSVASPYVARWNGSSWSSVGGGLVGRGQDFVAALAVYDDGSGAALYAGGYFDFAENIRKWDGSAWTTLGTGPNGPVSALAVFDDGTGPALFVGGAFTLAGGMTANCIAKWNGSAWSAVGGGSGSVSALLTFDDGSGEALYVAGSFIQVGAVPANRIAKWNGSTWSTLGSGLSSHFVSALTSFHDGAGLVLIAGGGFTVAGGLSANRIAKWNGSAWSTLGSGASDTVHALASFDSNSDGTPDLYAGGAFLQAGGELSARIARWSGCEPGTAYCFGDGVDTLVATACPCGNFGDPGRGCANSNSSLGGAFLTASGTTSPNTIVFTCDGIPNNNLSTFLRGTIDTPAGAVFGDGVKCASGTVLRFGQQTSGQGGNPANSVVSGTASVAAGNTRYYQVHYRNPSAGFCPPETFNISNGYSVAW